MLSSEKSFRRQAWSSGVGQAIFMTSFEASRSAERATRATSKRASASYSSHRGRDVDAAHVALMAAVRQQDDFQVQEVLQVLKGGPLLRRSLRRKGWAMAMRLLHLASSIAARSEGRHQRPPSSPICCTAGADLEVRNLMGRRRPLAPGGEGIPGRWQW